MGDEGWRMSVVMETPGWTGMGGQERGAGMGLGGAGGSCRGAGVG